ncbi:MAG: hypothetical protein Q7J78_06535 [Clostridiales bacterium]|nr:hypothetical protein [Clostridiales bacterium]
MDTNNYIGVIIEESLENADVLGKIKILKTDTSPVTEAHQTPWLEKWTLHTIEIDESSVEAIAELIRKSLDTKEEWYADFRNDEFHYVIFRDKIFKIDRSRSEQYTKVKEYRISKGIPDYQLDICR